MAVANPQDLGFVDREKFLAAKANPAFAVGSVAVPLACFAASYALGSLEGLFYTHVAAGALWFSIAVLFTVAIGPALGGVDPEVAGQVNDLLAPKLTHLAFGVSITTVLSGTALAHRLGLLGVGHVWVTAALVLGWGLFAFGLGVTHRLLLKSYYESHSPDPDPERIERIGALTAKIGLVEMVGMLAIVLVMTNIRF